MLDLTFQGFCEKDEQNALYDRAIRFIGAIIMAVLAIGGSYLLGSGELFSK